METNHHAAMTAGADTPKNDGAGSACDAPAPGKLDQQTEPHFADDEASRKALAPCLRCVGDLLRRIGGRP